MKELVNEYLLEAGPKLKPNTYKTRADHLHDFGLVSCQHTV